jgi:hypothetical protein
MTAPSCVSHPLGSFCRVRPSQTFRGLENFDPGLSRPPDEPPDLQVLLARLFPEMAAALATTILTVNDVVQYIVELGTAEWENEIDRTIGGVQYHGHQCALIDALTDAFLDEVEDAIRFDEDENHLQYLLNHLQEL